jgi:hypothetical protein
MLYHVEAKVSVIHLLFLPVVLSNPDGLDSGQVYLETGVFYPSFLSTFRVPSSRRHLQQYPVLLEGTTANFFRTAERNFIAINR